MGRDGEGWSGAEIDIAMKKGDDVVRGGDDVIRSYGGPGLAVSTRHPYMFSAGDDKQVKCWDLEQNKVRNRKQSSGDGAGLCANHLWVRHSVWCWPQVIRSYHGHLSGVYCMTLHPTLDVVMTGGRDSVCRVGSTPTAQQSPRVRGTILIGAQGSGVGHADQGSNFRALGARQHRVLRAGAGYGGGGGWGGMGGVGLRFCTWWLGIVLGALDGMECRGESGIGFHL